VNVHVRTLLHPALPQPDAGRVYRCLTEFPGRVPVATCPCPTWTTGCATAGNAKYFSETIMRWHAEGWG
jgi:hypothetical protein